MSVKEKVILDTDIGTDIDDAFALAYLLSEPKCDLLGITTVTGQPLLRARMASAQCLVMGRKEIPIYPGTEDPIIIPQKQKKAQQAVMLKKWEHRKSFPKSEAIEFLRQTIHENPGEVTLLAIGPMTNVGLLFSVDPEVPKLLKELVLMCGVFSYNNGWGPMLLEWNAIGDPHATSIMYRAPVRNIRSFGLDVTTRVTMPAADVRKKMTAKALAPVKDFLTQWGAPVVTFHDPLAAVSIFHRDVCGYRRGDVEVELESSKLAGLTSFRDNPKGANEVAFEVNASKFFKIYFDTIGG
ncbi:nucleoside hydrolase [Spirochaetia bacterium]|nr:nucleoside hydrolase [Spirochaetia bacterium]